MSSQQTPTTTHSVETPSGRISYASAGSGRPQLGGAGSPPATMVGRSPVGSRSRPPPHRSASERALGERCHVPPPTRTVRIPFTAPERSSFKPTLPHGPSNQLN